MPIPYSILYSNNTEKEKVLYGKFESRRTGKRDILHRDRYKEVEIIDGAVCDGSYSFKCSNTTKVQYFKIYGIFKR